MPERDDEQLLQAVAAAVRRAPPASADLDRRIMAAVRASRAPWWRVMAGWLTAPRAIRVSPVGALAYAAGFALAVVLASYAIHGPSSVLATRDTQPSSTAGAARDGVVSDDAHVVRFVFVAPQAASVALVGDFNRWSVAATPLQPAGVTGVWTVDVPLRAGRHEYAFVVDGAWIPDPAAPRAPVAEFGLPNSIITVTPELS